MEKLKLGPDVLLTDNPKLIYARLTGFGGNGYYADRAGHDINYIATSGVLSMFGRKGEKPYAPVNFAADFAGGGLLCAFGICTALLERNRSGKGQVVDSAMVDGSAYVASWMFRCRDLPGLGNPRGENLLDGGAFFYDTYETKDGKFMSVGALEPQFYSELLRGLQLTDDEVPQFGGDNEKNKAIFTNIFKSKTQDEWRKIFDSIDACVMPVVDWTNASEFEHNRDRRNFKNPKVPNPAPKLSRTPAVSSFGKEEKGEFETAVEIFNEIGMSKEQILELVDEKVLLLSNKPKL